MMFQPFYAFQRAFALAAGIGIVYKLTLEKRGHVVVVQMMYNPVAELRGKHFAFNRILHHKTYRRRWFVAAVAQLVIQLYKIGFQIHLETQLARGVAFVATCVVICPEQISEECVHLVGKGLDEAHGLPVAPIVAVHVHFARIEVEVPSVVRTIGRGRPIVAVGAHVVHIAIAIAVARGGQNI